MRIFLKGILLFSFLSSVLPSSAQRPNRKFGDITPDDFKSTVYTVDSSAHAVVLFDIASSTYEGDVNGGFQIIFKRHKRIRILNRNAFDIATVSLPLYASGSLEEKIESLEATTYNIEGGKVESFKLDKSSIFKDRINKNFTVRKFTMPNLKEGSIIDIKYALNSPYERDLRSWQFQGGYPALWSEYKVTIPSVYEFVSIKTGYNPYVVDDASTGRETYHILVPGQSGNDRSQTVTFPTTTTIHIWAMENVPALKQENFTTTIDNHISKVDFQLAKIQFPNSPEKTVMSNWYSVSKTLMENEYFGESLTKNNGWLADELKLVTAGATTPLEVARKIFEYFRNTFTCTNHSSKYLSNPLKKIYQAKNGSVADINLLLTAALLNKGLEAYPVLLSTREHGRATATYPILDQMNYVVSELVIDGQAYMLDASQSKLGFGKLSTDCYNGYARIINKDNPTAIDLSADSLKESKVTMVIMANNEKGGLMGSFTSNLGDNESYQLREKIAKTSKEEFFKDVKKEFSFDVEVSNEQIDSLKNYEVPVAVKYDFKFDTNEDIIYLNPILGEAYKENPFKAAERLYPVEMPFTTNETFILNMDIPKGYKIEEVPKSARVAFNENEGMFEYLVSKDESKIQLRSTIKIKKANFLPGDYQTLRDFFGHIVKKHSEQIVFKKIK